MASTEGGEAGVYFFFCFSFFFVTRVMRAALRRERIRTEVSCRSACLGAGGGSGLMECESGFCHRAGHEGADWGGRTTGCGLSNA